MAQSALGSFAAPFQPTQEAINPLQALIQGFQLPQQLQDQALAQQLNNALMKQKLADLLNPNAAVAREIQKQLAIKGILEPTTGITPSQVPGQVIQTPGALSPEQQAALIAGGAQPSVGAGAPINPIKINGIDLGLSIDPAIAAKAQSDELNQKIAIARAGHPETYMPIISDQGMFSLGRQSGAVAPLTTGGGTQLKKPQSENVRQITNSEGLLFNQPIVGGPMTPAIDPNTGQQFNAGIANKVIFGDQGAFSMPSKTEGGTTPSLTPLNTPEEQGGVQLTKGAGKASAALEDKLYNEAQKNKAYQAFRTVSDAVEGLQATLDYAKTNPSDQTGIKSSAVDAFNKIINPNSVVRQQAFTQTTSGQSLINKAENFFNGLSTGQTITPEQIQSMLDLAKQYEKASKESARKEMAVIKNRGDNGGLNVERYLPGLFQETSTKTPFANSIPAGTVVKQGGKSYLFDGTNYTEVK